jgi:hypothetical protein
MSITQINDLKKNTNENVFDDKHEKIYIKEKSEFIQTDLDKSPNNNKAKTNNDNEIKNNSSPSTKQTKKPRAFNVTEVDNIHQLADDKLKEYQKIIDEHPDQLFLEISPEIVSKWKLILFSSFHPEELCTISEIEKLPEIPYAKVIRNDINRTRVREWTLIPDYKEKLEFFLFYFCSKHQIDYKQGLNETIGGLLLMLYKLPISYSDIYNMFYGFVSRFYTNYYFEKELYSLKSSMALVRLLMKYHEPDLYNKFESYSIAPEMYALNWLMAGFAGKMRIDHLYHFWNYLIEENDNMFLHFLIIAFLKVKKPSFDIPDFSLLIVIISQLSIDSLYEIDEIYSTALQIRKTTPFSFRLLANMLQIFEPKSTKLKQMYELIKPENIIAMPVFPNEVLHITYNDILTCPIEHCPNTMKLEIKNNDGDDNVGDLLNVNTNERFICEHCNMKIKKETQYILIDLRILETGYFHLQNKPGLIPKLISVPTKELKSDDFVKIITERFSEDKGKFHFVLLTSKTDYFLSFDNHYNNNDVNNNNHSKMDKQTLQEYNILKNIMVNFIENNFPYVSYVYGGFYAIHQQSLKYDITLLEHYEKICSICKDNKKLEKTKKNKEKIKDSEELHLPRKKLSEIKQAIKIDDSKCFEVILKGLQKQFDKKVCLIFNGNQIELYRLFKSSNEDCSLIHTISIFLIYKISLKSSEKHIITIKYKYSPFDKEVTDKPEPESTFNMININNDIIYQKSTIVINFLFEREALKFFCILNKIKQIAPIIIDE